MQRIAHDLRQLLTAIVLALDMLEKDCPQCSGRKRSTIIRSCVEQIEAILADAVQNAKLTTNGRPDLNKTIAALEEVLADDGSGIAVVLEPDPQVPLLRAGESPVAIFRMLLNLCSNGRHAIIRQRGERDVTSVVYDSSGETPGLATVLPEGGTLTLGTQAIGAEDSGRCFAAVYVKDDGTGMDAAGLVRMVERMRGGEGDIDADGHGHGLQIVQAQVARMGGKVEVQSAPGLGTTFTLKFPVEAASAAVSG